MQKILIIEDEEAMRLQLADLLKSSGYIAETLDVLKYESDGLATLIEDIIARQADLLLLDINLAGINGELLLKNLRTKEPMPVIMLTSSSSEMDEVLSMSYGADDYVTKPYNPQILLLRIAAVLKRLDTTRDTSVQFRDLKIDLVRGVMENNGKRIFLTKNEMIILSHLLDRRGEIVTRDALMTDLWNNHEYINDNALTVNVSRVRSKLKQLGADNAIETRKGLGYILS